jgi:hypothetical protein
MAEPEKRPRFSVRDLKPPEEVRTYRNIRLTEEEAATLYRAVLAERDLAPHVALVRRPEIGGAPCEVWIDFMAPPAQGASHGLVLSLGQACLLKDALCEAFRRSG